MAVKENPGWLQAAPREVEAGCVHGCVAMNAQEVLVAVVEICVRDFYGVDVAGDVVEGCV